MAFLGNLGKTLTDMGRDAAQKTKDIVDTLQIKAQIGTEKSKLRDLYATIGKSYYEVHKDPAGAEHAEACGQIESSLVKTAELEERTSRLDNTVTCPSYGAVLDKSSAFCNCYGVAVVSSSQDLMMVGEDTFDEADNVVAEDIKKDIKETAGDIVMEGTEKTEE